MVAPQWGPEPDRMITMDKSEHNKPEIGRKVVQTRHRYPIVEGCSARVLSGLVGPAYCLMSRGVVKGASGE